MQRWEETVAWANINGCLEFVKGIPDNEFYFVSEPTSYTVGPFGGPMYLPWNFDSKLIPSYEEITRHFEELKSRWSEIVGLELAHITRPISFTGRRHAACLSLPIVLAVLRGVVGRTSLIWKLIDAHSQNFEQSSIRLLYHIR